MGRVLTNDVSLQFAKEASLGALPGSPDWKMLEPNSFSGFGATVTTVARAPISPNRQRRKGTITDLDSAATFEEDLTLASFLNFLEGFVFAKTQRGMYERAEFRSLAVTAGGSGGYTIDITDDTVAVVAVSTANVAISTDLQDTDTLDGVTLATGDLVLLVAQTAPAENGLYTVVASGAASRATAYDTAAELAGVRVRAAGGSTNIHKVYENNQVAADIVLGTTSITFNSYSPPAASTLVFARGFATAANNGLKTVAAGSTSTNIRVNGLTAETVAATENATVEIAGYSTAAGDLDVNASGNLTSTSLDFRTLGLSVGQFIWVGGDAALNKFSNAANSGLARVTAIAQNLLTLDKKTQAFVTEANTTQEVHIYFGRFVKNVQRSNYLYSEQSFQFEAAYPNLISGSTGFEYSKGNYCNQMTITLPLTDKATVEFGFIGTDTPAPSTTRATNASSPRKVVRRDAFNTTPDVLRLRVTEVDETGITTDFKNATIIFNNNVSPEKVIGTLGARYMNTGNFEVNIDTSVLFTSEGVLAAIRANDTVTMEIALKNEDGGLVLDVPAMTMGGGGKEMPVNESVQLQSTGEAFEHSTLGTSIGVSVFPYLPAA